MYLRTALLLAGLGLATIATSGPAQSGLDEVARARVLGIEEAVIQVVNKVRPSTVAILSLRKVTFEGRERLAATSGGSGVIIDAEGYIVTNDHVAGHCDGLLVVLEDGSKVPAELVAKDEKGDIALLKIEGSRHPAATLGDSSQVKVGDWVFAVGNPFFLGADGDPVVTLGVVSGKHRVLGGRWEYGDSIQIDAEINPGNSGGPLFDLKGQLIGINGKIATRHGLRANTGAGYAIPVDVVKKFLPRLRKGQDIERGYTGLMLADESDLRGVRVKLVVPGSPADDARMREGDVVLAVNGKTVTNGREWVNSMSRFTAGQSVTLTIKRGNRSRTVRLKLAVDPVRIRAAEKRAEQLEKQRNQEAKRKDTHEKDGRKQ